MHAGGQAEVSIAVEASGQQVVIGYNDTFSDDGGRHWSPAVPLTKRPFHAGWGNDTGQPNLGDYNQAAAQHGQLYAAYALASRPRAARERSNATFHQNANDNGTSDPTRWERLFSPNVAIPADSDYVTLSVWTGDPRGVKQVHTRLPGMAVCGVSVDNLVMRSVHATGAPLSLGSN